MVSELAVQTGLGWTGELVLTFHERGAQQLCSSVVFITRGRCVAVTKCAMKNQREHRRCITIVSFEEPLLIVATNPSLSHWKLM